MRLLQRRIRIQERCFDDIVNRSRRQGFVNFSGQSPEDFLTQIRLAVSPSPDPVYDASRFSFGITQAGRQFSHFVLAKIAQSDGCGYFKWRVVDSTDQLLGGRCAEHRESQALVFGFRCPGVIAGTDGAKQILCQCSAERGFQPIQYYDNLMIGIGQHDFEKKFSHPL